MIATSTAGGGCTQLSAQALQSAESLDRLAAHYVKWIENEANASMSDMATMLDVEDSKLASVVAGQMTWAKINQSWDNICSCGQNRTLSYDTSV